MYCNKCKKNLNDDFKHCPYCGEKLKELEKVTVPQKTSSNSYDETVNLFLADRKLTFSKKCIEYNNFRNLFCEKGEKLEDEYIEYYNSSKHTFESVFEEQIPTVMKKIDEAIEFGISVLSEYGINSISGEEIARYITEYVEADFKYIGNKVNAILSIDNESIETREKFAQYNQYWSSGGFGIKEAIKGVIQSEVLNIGTNLLQNAIGGVVRAIDKIAIKQMQKDFGENKEVFYHLHNPIYLSTLHTGNFVYEQLKEKNLIVDYKPDIDDEWWKNRAKLKPCLETYFSTPYTIELYNETINTICDCITKDVYMPEAYLGLYKILKKDHGDIERIARYFGEGRNYKRNIIQYDMERIEELKDMPEDSLDNINIKINKIELIIKNNPHIDAEAYLEPLCSKRDQYLKEQAKNISELEMVSMYKASLRKTLSSNDPEQVWSLAQAGNPYAEEILITYYYKLCEPYLGALTYSDEMQIDKILDSVIKKARIGNSLACFILLYMKDKSHTTEGLTLVKKILAENRFVAPLYYIGYMAITHRTITGEGWNHGFHYVSKEDALRYMKKAAQKLFPPALKYLAEIYKYGKFGLTGSNSALSEYYLKLSKQYELN